MTRATWLLLLGGLSLPVILLVFLLVLLALAPSLGRFWRQGRAFKKGASLEDARDYKEACWVYAGAAADDPRLRECHERILDLWSRYGPFDYAEKVAAIEGEDYIDESCKCADLAFTTQQVERIKRIVAGANMSEPRTRVSVMDGVMGWTLLLWAPSRWLFAWRALWVAVVIYGIGQDIVGVLPSIAGIAQRWPWFWWGVGAAAFAVAAFGGAVRQAVVDLEHIKITSWLGAGVGVAVLSVWSAATMAALSQPLPAPDSVVSPFLAVFIAILALRWAVSAVLSTLVARRLRDCLER